MRDVASSSSANKLTTGVSRPTADVDTPVPDVAAPGGKTSQDRRDSTGRPGGVMVPLLVLHPSPPVSGEGVVKRPPPPIHAGPYPGGLEGRRQPSPAHGNAARSPGFSVSSSRAAPLAIYRVSLLLQNHGQPAPADPQGGRVDFVDPVTKAAVAGRAVEACPADSARFAWVRTNSVRFAGSTGGLRASGVRVNPDF